jgi:transposase
MCLIGLAPVQFAGRINHYQPSSSGRTGFFRPVHVKSLSAHALRALIIARKKFVGQRGTLENQIRGLAVVFGVPLPPGSVPHSRSM